MSDTFMIAQPWKDFFQSVSCRRFVFLGRQERSTTKAQERPIVAFTSLSTFLAKAPAARTVCQALLPIGELIRLVHIDTSPGRSPPSNLLGSSTIIRVISCDQ